jgi:hypothetical protein
MAATKIDLASLFNAVSKELQANQSVLNEADTYNHNHGDNMVNNFKVITKALKRKQDAPPTEQLAYASQVLQKRAATGSAKLYAAGLANAAEAVRGQPVVTPENAMGLIQALMGGGQAPQSVHESSQALSGDMLGSLVGSLLGGGISPAGQPTGGSQQAGDMSDLLGSLLGSAMSSPSQQQSESHPSGDMGDLLGSLLGGSMVPPQSSSGDQQTGGLSDLLGSLLGGGALPQPAPSQTAQPQSSDMIGNLLGSLLGGTSGSSGSQSGVGLNLSTLLAMGMAYLQAKQQGSSPIQAILNVLMSGSQMNDTAYHSQSGNLVAGTLINTIGSLMSGK